MFHLYCLFHKSSIRVKIIKYLYPHILPFLTFLLLWVPALSLEPWFLFWAPYHPLNCATILFIYVLHQLWRVLWILATLFRMSDFWGLGTQPGGVRHPRPPSFFLKFHVLTTPLNLTCHGGNIQVVFIIILFRMPSSKGLVGLAISYALSVTDRLSGMVTSFTETEKQMVSVERAVQYIEDVQPEISPRGTVSINNKWLVFTSSNLFLPWPWLRQEMTRVKTLLIVLRSGRFSSFAHNCFRYLIFFGTAIRGGSCSWREQSNVLWFLCASKAFNELLYLYDLRRILYSWLLSIYRHLRRIVHDWLNSKIDPWVLKLTARITCTDFARWSILKLNFTFRSFPLGHLVVSLPSRKSALFIGKGTQNSRIINSLKLPWLIL